MYTRVYTGDKRTLPFLFLLLGIFSLFSYFLLYPFCKYVWGKSDIYHIRLIAQKKPPQDALKCLYLEEMLDLSMEQKISLSHFNVQKGREKLLTFPIFKEAEILKIKPHLLFVDYTLRQPLAYLGDFANSVIDREGVIFPFVPFFSPKVLPEIFLGKESISFSENGLWGGRVDREKMDKILEILELLPLYSLRYLDLSQLDSPSLGKREVVAEVEEGSHLFLLRLSPKNYVEEIQRYFVVRKNSLKAQESCTVDLRIPEVAFITNEKK